MGSSATIRTAVRLEEYLAARNESVWTFAKRANVLPKTLYRYLNGRVQQITDEHKIRIRDATRHEPAPDGGTVELEDLVRSA